MASGHTVDEFGDIAFDFANANHFILRCFYLAWEDFLLPIPRQRQSPRAPVLR